jgi:AcrR family transcriptional regulator
MFITKQFGSHCSGFEEIPVTKKTEDRRVQRTRQSLRDALIELIIEKGYEEVTVQDIIDRANVGRSTFYSHFMDKQQLLLSGLKQFREFLAQHQQSGKATDAIGSGEERLLNFSLAMFQHAESHYRLYQAMVGKQSGAFVLRHMQRMIADLAREELEVFAKRANPKIPPNVIAQYAASSLMGLLIWWADQKMPRPAEEMDRMFRALTLPGINAALSPVPVSMR